jgi:hypothetical protein
MKIPIVNNKSNESDANEKVRYWLAIVVADAPLLLEKIHKNTLLKQHTKAEQGLEEVLRFLYLCAHSNSTLTPSALVDSVWHEFILFTRHYGRFCEKQIGYFIHHQPSADQGNELLQYQQTLALYEHTFGICEAFFWPRPQKNSAQCGPCENE